MLSYKGRRYPVEVINHYVWLYFRFPLSFREVAEMMLQRGVVVSYETIRRWCATFGQASPTGCFDDAHGPVTRGTSTRCTSESTATNIICGARSTSTATYSMCWSSPDEMATPPNDSSVSYSKVPSMCRG